MIPVPTSINERQDAGVSILLTECERAVVRKFFAWYMISVFVRESGAENTSQPIITVHLSRTDLDVLIRLLQQFMSVIYLSDREEKMSTLS